MPATAFQQATPGHPVERDKPYTWVTWLAKLLGGDQCEFKVWFMSHYKHAKLPERDAEKLVEWNREHTDLMRARRVELEANGWTCQAERDFKLEGRTAILAGKEDLVATMPGHILIVDGKTGRRRDADFFQVLLYLYARVKGPRPAQPGTKLAGEVFYKTREIVNVRVADVQRYDADISEAMQRIASPTRPTPNPSRFECGRCSIRREDCPERYQDGDDVVSTEDF